MVTKKKYIEYLVHTPINYTCTNLANHTEGMSHDAISDYLARENATGRHIWELAREVIRDGMDAYLIADDSVADKRYSRKIELVKKQYSGAVHGLTDGIDVVNLVHSDGENFIPIDYRIYAPDQDGKTKNDHFQEMLIRAKKEKGIKANTVLIDSWYASVDNLKLIHRMGMTFVTTLKENRLVSLSKEGGYIHLQDIEWTQERLEHGVRVKLKELPFQVQLFKIVAQNGDIDWVITNNPENPTAQVVQEENKVRWKIEEMHREMKQLMGLAKCQARKARSQRNHISYCYQGWFALKMRALELGKTAYALKHELLNDYLRTVLKTPVIPVYHLSG